MENDLVMDEICGRGTRKGKTDPKSYKRRTIRDDNVKDFGSGADGSYGIVATPDVQKQRKLNGDGGKGGADEG